MLCIKQTNSKLYVLDSISFALVYKSEWNSEGILGTRKIKLNGASQYCTGQRDVSSVLLARQSARINALGAQIVGIAQKTNKSYKTHA